MKRNSPKTVRVTDMTEGNPLRTVLAFAVPLLIGNVFQQIYNLVDTSVVGHCIGDSAISAIGATSSLYMLLISLISSLNSGYTIVTARAFGSHNEEKIKKSIAGTFLLNAGTAILITVLATIFLKPLMHFMNTPESIFEDAYSYILIICLGLTTTICYNMFAGILRAIGNSKTPLYCLIISSFINIGLDLLFVAGFNMGVNGAAIATVFSQFISALLCGLAFFINYPLYIPKKADFNVQRSIFIDLSSTGAAMALMMCVVNLGTMIFQRANNALGEEYITAYASGRRIISIVMQPLGSIAEANSTFVSQNWGARKYNRIITSLKKVMTVEILWGTIACILIYIFGDSIVRIVTGSENSQIIADSVLCMRASAPFFPVLGVLLCLRTSMQAMGYKKSPVISSCVELGMKFVGAVFVIPVIGFVGSCFTEPITWVFMTLYLVIAFLFQRKTIFGNE